MRRGRPTRILGAALRTRRGQVGATLTGLVFAVGFLGPLLAPESPLASVDVPFAPPGGGNGVLGADVLGRDVLSRVLCGGDRLLLITLAATAIGVGIGALAGIVAAYRGGAPDGLIMRSADVVLGVPQLVLILLLLSMVGPHTWLIILAVGLTQAPQVARVLHASAQDVSERDFVKAAESWGVPPRTVIRRHLLPNLLTPLMVEIGLRIGWSMVVVSGLSFLGFGATAPNPDWGVMIAENRIGLAANPWGVLAPAILLAVLAVGASTLSDAIARANLSGEAGADPVLKLILAEMTETDSAEALAPREGEGSRP